jgi:hypothetical protein
MRKWEYMVYRAKTSVDPKQLVSWLHELETEGWELVSTYTAPEETLCLILRRPGAASD